MTMTTAIPPLTVRGTPVDAPEPLEDCTPLLGDVAALREQMATNGYVFLPGDLGRDRVRAARRVFIDKLHEAGMLHPDRDPMDGVMAPDDAHGFADVEAD